MEHFRVLYSNVAHNWYKIFPHRFAILCDERMELVEGIQILLIKQNGDDVAVQRKAVAIDDTYFVKWG